jgi:hypothetical protein
LNPGGEGLVAGNGVGGLLDEALQLCQRGLFKQAEAVYRRAIAIAIDAGVADGSGFVKINIIVYVSVVGPII